MIIGRLPDVWIRWFGERKISGHGASTYSMFPYVDKFMGASRRNGIVDIMDGEQRVIEFISF